MAFPPQHAHRIGHSAAGDFATRGEPQELDLRLGCAVLAAIDDEAEPAGLTRAGELEELGLVAVRGEHRVLGRVRRVVIAEAAGSSVQIRSIVNRSWVRIAPFVNLPLPTEPLPRHNVRNSGTILTTTV